MHADSADSNPSQIQKRSVSRFGRTALIVLLVAISTSAAIVIVKRFAFADSYEGEVLTIMSGIIGMVGLFWTIVLTMRGALRGEPLIWPFLIALLVFWIASIPMIGTWSADDRGGDNNWSYFHFICLPMVLPLLAISFSVGLPIFAWMYLRAIRSSDAKVQSSTKQKAWLYLNLISSVMFMGMLPFAFYAYGGTMGPNTKIKHWTTKVAHKMPRWLGDWDFRIMEVLSNQLTINARSYLLARGLVSSTLLIEKLEALGLNVDDRGIYFSYFARYYSEDALRWIRNQRSHIPPIAFNIDTAEHFAQFANDGEVRPLFELPHFEAMDYETQRGLIDGLMGRKDAKEYLLVIEALMAGKQSTTDLTWKFIESYADDATAIRLYIGMIGVKDLRSATTELTIQPRGDVIAAALMVPDVQKQQLVMSALLSRTSITPGSQIVRQRKVPAYRTAFSLLLNSPESLNRVLAALLVHQYSFALSQKAILQYGLATDSNRLLEFKPDKWRGVKEEDNQALVEDARRLLEKW